MISPKVLRVEPKDAIGLSVRGLTVSVSKGEGNKILNDVSLKLEPGKMMAIMGGSGSGKTTLLNTLSQRLNYTNKDLKFSGEIEYTSGPDQNQSPSFVKNAYMLQTDCFLPGLTVMETLKFQADLRMPSNTTEEEKLTLIESLLEVLELQLLKQQIVCTFASSKTNLSGGEQRRVSLAIQLLSKPSILFLDEPTTGLDTSSSLKLVHTLRKLASPEFNVTIILSIHQPRPEISVLFDKICLLTRGGRLVYYGNLIDSWAYFSSIDFLTSQDVSTRNVMEYIMDLSVKDTTSTEEKELESIERINKLVEAWKNSQAGVVFTSTSAYLKDDKTTQKRLESNLKSFSDDSKVENKNSLFREITILTKRTFILSYRDRASLLALNGGSAILAIVVGWMFYKPKEDIAGIRSLISCLYVMLEVVGFCPMFIEIERLWMIDILFFFREYKENYVTIPGFIISRRLGKFLLEDLPLPVIFATITYFMFGLRIDGSSSYYFIYLALTFLTHIISMSTALAVVALTPDFGVSATIINLYYQLQNSACGYFINAATMPVYVRWTKYITFFWYAFGALTANQFTDWMGDCEGDNCTEYSGNYQLGILGYPQNWITAPICILVAYFFMINFAVCVGLYYRNSNIKLAKTKVDRISKDEEEQVPEVIENSNATEDSDTSSWCESNNDTIDINLQGITLDVMVKDKDHPLARKSNLALLAKAPTVSKTLLNDISAHFSANTVNAIMGPSGSGKTTLLNFLSSRLSKSSKYIRQGEIKFNGNQIVSNKELSEISAYVTQHDTALIPNLTVRETLYFQARLRLSPSEHSQIPHIINSLIRRIGLSDCADNLIGSEYKKGISGGEKRRVSIAIQLLSRPKILFLDEPTSGLDSTTACSILTLLNELASESNSTIITTIHQPSEDIFLKFSNVLLLAKGGRVAFNGPSSSAEEYFENLGFKCPANINIADYFLDLVSSGLAETKEETQARVDCLVGTWHSQVEEQLKLESLKVVDSEREKTLRTIDLQKFQKVKLPVSVTFPVIASRQLLNSVRSPDVLFTRAFQTVFLAIVHALYFSPLRNTQDGVSNRLGLVQEVLNLYYVGLINNITLFPIERDIFLQEYKDGIYGPIEFSTSYLINELPMEIVPVLFLAAMLVFVVGLPRTPGMFFSMFFACFVSISCGESLGIFVNSVFDHLGLATNILSTLIIIAIFMGGTMSVYMPSFFKGINYINPMSYAVGLIANLGFEDQVFSCESGDTCELSTGDNVLEYYNLKKGLPGLFGGLIGCLIIYRAIAVATLYVKAKYRS
ncbi:uncharacterized ABC transporter ATP-binding protein/permease [[Candida] railenensis]|uniref:Uncharacterized ABC transporter ATP-binding protein/permease n=1 Tax=[Candida] railenensis TaxID=45579 RepID=A0A9P0VZ77_9ASCO|nr:uncharacterized ABC transporter ATP-binding protein/permease [[Candida] railenensis]